MKGTSKKQKEKLGVVNYKMTQVKKYKEKIEETIKAMEYVNDTNVVK